MSQEKILSTEPNRNNENTSFNVTNLPKITSNSINRRNSYTKTNRQSSLKKKKRNITAIRLNKNRFKNNRDLDLVYKLNMEQDVDQIFEEDMHLRKQKYKIDNNKEVLEKRLNIYKSKFNTNLEKIDNKEKERLIEKGFKDEFKELEKLKNECHNLNDEINEKNNQIVDYKLELNIFNNFQDYFSNNNFFNEEQKSSKNDSELGEIPEEIISPGRKFLKIKDKNEKFANYYKFNEFKNKSQEKIKTLNENIEKEETNLKNLENKLNELVEKCKIKKKEIYTLRKKLYDIYHINLYEGLNFRGDGLTTLIRSIWNLGVNVDTNYMPNYLDSECINYLFERAKRLIEIAKMRQLIEENNKEFIDNLAQWKKNNNENNKDENSDDEKNDNTNSQLFQTGVMNQRNYMDKYPKSKQFMEDYKKKHHIDCEDEDSIAINKGKSYNIPLRIIEKHKNVEKLKYLLQKLINENEKKEKKEIERLSKEFLTNNYAEKYKVSYEVLIGALCGDERKDDGIILFSRLQKEYREGKKLIQFYSNLDKHANK